MATDTKPMKQQVSAIDLFCGAGGLSLGLRDSGVIVQAGLDNDPDCQFSYQENIGAKFLLQDIREVTGDVLSSFFKPDTYRLLAACAPCQPFSGYSLGKGRTNKDWGLLLEVARLIGEIAPEFVTIENVPRLVHEKIWIDFVGSLEEQGYFCDWAVLDASKYSVPQSRQRLVLVASKLGPISLPNPTSDKPITVRLTIGHLPSISAGETCVNDEFHCARSLSEKNLARVRASKQGGTWKDWPKRMRAACHKRETGATFPSVYGRMSWDKPSPTITTQFYGYGNGRFGHPDQDRAVSLREGALLQSFPLSFCFSSVTQGQIRQIGKLIGNAVPPKLAESIGKAFVDHAATFAT